MKQKEHFTDIFFLNPMILHGKYKIRELKMRRLSDVFFGVWYIILVCGQL